MSDTLNTAVVPVPDEAKNALSDLEAQVAGLEAMIAGARQARMDTSVMEQTIKALKDSMAALRSIPGAK